jgi:NADPH-dependent ferric siderophore reductase
VERLSPHMVRVTLAGEELEGFEPPSPTQHIKLIMPEPGQDRPVLPDPNLPRGAVGPGQPRPLMRTYTVRGYDPAAAEMDVDFVIHGHGAGSDWATNAQPGGLVALAGPGGRRYEPDPEAKWFVLAGDESALPAMSTLLEALPRSAQVQIYAEVAEASDALEWGSARQCDVTWLHRDSKSTGELLAATLARAERPSGDGRVWLATEAMIMRRIRKHLLENWHLDPAAMVTRGYWKLAESNYRDSDYGED